MSSKLFAFNVSKKPEKAENQWVGDLIARATVIGQCTGGQNYGLEACAQFHPNQCTVWGLGGYYICDGNCPDAGGC